MNSTQPRHHDHRAIVLFAHGSSEPRWAEPFEALQNRLSERLPGVTVRLAFLERMPPGLGEVVEDLAKQGVKAIDVAPVFLALGSHLREDLPRLIQSASAAQGVTIRVLPAIGEISTLLDAIADAYVTQHLR